MYQRHGRAVWLKTAAAFSLPLEIRRYVVCREMDKNKNTQLRKIPISKNPKELLK